MGVTPDLVTRYDLHLGIYVCLLYTYIDGLVKSCTSYSVIALEILQSYTEQSISKVILYGHEFTIIIQGDFSVSGSSYIPKCQHRNSAVNEMMCYGFTYNITHNMHVWDEHVWCVLFKPTRTHHKPMNRKWSINRSTMQKMGLCVTW